ncbi:MAG: acyl-ACP--UDP-N-acetylglucosamine O-acyltransferase [Deltaproteobacteria bacterium]|nr:acyl-ACP--UDP-N-acetylglucosamine O-acyltransferase [Deltaproteobacteria bacterium]
MKTTIHPTAIVHPKAKLGQGVVVGPFTLIEEDSEIGDRTMIGSHSLIRHHTRLGQDNQVHSYASLGDDPQDLKYDGEETWLVIGDRNRIREFTTLNRGSTSGAGKTVIGSDCFVMAYAHIAHDCRLADGVVLANGATLAGHVHVGQRTVIGGLAAVHQYTRIGDMAFIGGKSAVSQDIPPFMLANGDRAKLHGPNVVGLKRAGLTREEISALKKAYQTIWRSGQRKESAVEAVEAEFGNLGPIVALLDFLRTTKRGVAGPGKRGEGDPE